MRIEKETFCAFLRYMHRINSQDIRKIDFSELLDGKDLSACEKEGLHTFFGDQPNISIILDTVLSDRVELLLNR